MPTTMNASDAQMFNLELPAFPAATRPIEQIEGRRDAVKLLVMHRHTGEFQDARFTELPTFLVPGDVLVVNTSQTIPARLPAVWAGTPLYVHLAARLGPNECIIERRTAMGQADDRPFPTGASLTIGRFDSTQTQCTLEVVRKFHPNSRLWVVKSNCDLYTVAQQTGEPIRYDYVADAQSTAAYQSIFSRHPGSSEMPCASRPFTLDVLKQLTTRGVQVCSLTLHTTVSSHEVTASLAEHPIVPEWYRIPKWTAQSVARATARQSRIIAVGTTVVRALEASAQTTGSVRAGAAWTDYLVTPETPLRVVNGLITGMHDNHSSHLALMYAFVRRETLRNAYAHAAAKGYHWHEFGDISLVI